MLNRRSLFAGVAALPVAAAAAANAASAKPAKGIWLEFSTFNGPIHKLRYPALDVDIHRPPFTFEPFQGSAHRQDLGNSIAAAIREVRDLAKAQPADEFDDRAFGWEG